MKFTQFLFSSRIHIDVMDISFNRSNFWSQVTKQYLLITKRDHIHQQLWRVYIPQRIVGIDQEDATNHTILENANNTTKQQHNAVKLCSNIVLIKCSELQNYFWALFFPPYLMCVKCISFKQISNFQYVKRKFCCFQNEIIKHVKM